MNLYEKALEVLRIEKEQLENLINCFSPQEFLRAIEILKNCKGKVIVSGVGKSGIVGKKLASTLSSLKTPSFFLDPLSALHGDLGALNKEDVLIAISNSGRTKELLKVVEFCKKNLKIPVIAITNNLKSPLAKIADIALEICVKKEACPYNLVPTSSVINSLALGDAIAITLAYAKNFTIEDFATIHPAGALGKKLKKIEDLKNWSNEKLPIMKEEDTALKILTKILQTQNGAVLIKDKEHIKGIITLEKIKELTKKVSCWENIKGKDLVEPLPPQISITQTVKEALEKMEKSQKNFLIVVNEQGEYIGILRKNEIN
jgi:arabinose-5-phosphate isomerase